MMLAVHVDDKFIASNDRSSLDPFKKRLNQRFECKNKGPVSYLFWVSLSRRSEASCSEKSTTTDSGIVQCGSTEYGRCRCYNTGCLA